MSLLNCPECGGLLSTEATSAHTAAIRSEKAGIGGVFHAITQIPCFIAG